MHTDVTICYVTIEAFQEMTIGSAMVSICSDVNIHIVQYNKINVAHQNPTFRSRSLHTPFYRPFVFGITYLDQAIFEVFIGTDIYMAFYIVANVP